MKKFFAQKKFLVLALLEESVVITFLFVLIASSIEILLPGLLANRLPLALFFTVFLILTLSYLALLKKHQLPLPMLTVPVLLQGVGIVFLTLVTLFMTRAFGWWAALIQAMLLGLLFWLWSKKD